MRHLQEPRVPDVRDVMGFCRMLLPVLAIALTGCSTTPDHGGPEGAWSDSWREGAPARLDPPRRGPAASGAMHEASSAREDSEATFILGSGRFVGEPAQAPRTSAEDVKDGVTVNLVNVPIPQAAKTILSDILAVKYTIDPGIEGKVTIQTPKPIAKSAVVDLFQAALRSNNAAVINSGGSYKIVSADQAVTGSIRVSGTAEPGERLGSRVEVVQLRYVAASEMRHILEPISPRTGRARLV